MMARILLREAVATREKKHRFAFERRKKPGAEGSRKRPIHADEME
jgi:hypothetical protein